MLCEFFLRWCLERRLVCALLIQRGETPIRAVLGLEFFEGKPVMARRLDQFRFILSPILKPLLLVNVGHARVARGDDLGNRRREFAGALHPRPRVGDVDDNFIRILLQHSPQRGQEAVRISVLIRSVCGEQDSLTAQDQAFPRVLLLQFVGRGRQASCFRIDFECFHASP